MLNDSEVEIQVEIQEDDNNSVSSHKILKKEKVKKTQKKKKIYLLLINLDYGKHLIMKKRRNML